MGLSSRSRRLPPRGSSITHRHTTLGRTPLDVWSARLSLPTHKTNAPEGIRISLSQHMAAVDPRLKPRGHWDRQTQAFRFKIKFDYLLMILKGCVWKDWPHNLKISPLCSPRVTYTIRIEGPKSGTNHPETQISWYVEGSVCLPYGLRIKALVRLFMVSGRSCFYD